MGEGKIKVEYDRERISISSLGIPKWWILILPISKDTAEELKT
jgi:hypothetical protein